MHYRELLKENFETKETIDELFSKIYSKMFKGVEITLDLEGLAIVSAYFLDRLENLMIRAKELETKILLVKIPSHISKAIHILNSRRTKKTVYS